MGVTEGSGRQKAGAGPLSTGVSPHLENCRHRADNNKGCGDDDSSEHLHRAHTPRHCFKYFHMCGLI